ncbi:aconitate hydratase [Helicovermis profundi]|uniref:Aconitate hydratase n=1 Tax=Helicovermis profundi TaxID=3065157 RepID=A0AAU9ENN6_9FIRM|nr:aconitate hydratase [Clostridia bacterium S502]
MNKSITYKILEKNLVKGTVKQGQEITVKVNQTLTQDSTGTMVYLQLEALSPNKIATDFSVAYIDHNTLQTGFENADDHEFIKTICAKYGVIYSKAGNGICHQLNLERFSKPNTILLGSDSHTPTGGGVGAIAIGAGGLDVAVAMAKGTYTLIVPKVLNINLSGKLNKWISAKDVILYILKILTVKGGVGYVIEYTGSGVKELSVTDRATITNMGAELGATTSIFPSDEITKDYFVRQGREHDFSMLVEDENVLYDKTLDINLSNITPQVAKPHSPDNIDDVKSIEGLKVDQVAIGSCTNSSYTDLMKVARILKGKKVHPDVSLVISPGSSNVISMLIKNGALNELINSGARILESACGPCIGMGQAPKTNAISLRTFNRNFEGRCGTKKAGVYLVSPETAAISAIKGILTSPKNLDTDPNISLPEKFDVSDSFFIFPNQTKYKKIFMGPNIKPFPLKEKLQNSIDKKIVLKTGDNITTDDIMPSNAKLLPFRSNVPELSKYCFKTIIDDFNVRCEKNNGGIIIGGDNYGQGSSREHAALVPLYLKIEAVIALSFARIHKANLINSGILPLVFLSKDDYLKINENDDIKIENIINDLNSSSKITITNLTQNYKFDVLFDGSKRDKEILFEGGYINYLKNMKEGENN